MSETLSHADIRNLLEGFAAAIGFDQRRVDTMPLWKFDPRYDEDMWRQWPIGSRNADLLCRSARGVSHEVEQEARASSVTA